MRIGVALFALAIPLALTAGPQDDAVFRDAATKSGQGEPLVRIGLDDSHGIEISSRGTFRVLDARDGKAAWRKAHEGVLRVVAEGGPEGDVPRIFRVQTGAYSTKDAAEREMRRLRQAAGVEGVVRHDVDRGNWRVRLGRAADRLALSPLIEKLRGMGVESPWVVEEATEAAGDVRMRLVNASYDSKVVQTNRLVVIPEGKSAIRIEGDPYRGVVELRLTPQGTVRPINWINIEHYLLGVVPAELGPEVWPEIEALRAQAIAARTYLWRNRGQFENDGYDLCATPRCQVYHGMSVEHPLSDRAVWSTRGEILVWEGEPIIALYTATCGGHTENGGEIFADHDVPYLTGVPCRAENDALATLRGTVRGRRVAPVRDETGRDVTRDRAVLTASGVIEDTKTRSATDPLDGGTLRARTSRLARLAGLTAPDGPAPDVSTLGEAVRSLVEDLGWDERAEVLLSAQDLPALVRDREADGLPPRQLRSLAYLAWIEGIKPFPDGRFGVSRPTTSARLVPALTRIGESYRAFGLREGVVSGVGKSSVRLIQGKGEIRLPWSERPFVFGRSGGAPVPAEELEIWPGDRLRFRTDGNGAIDFVELIPPVKGASDDRSAAVYSWEVRKTRRAIEAAVNRRVDVGRLEDLEVVRRGVSGRVVELRVVGSKASTIVRGFDVRGLLDLREILAVIEIQRDERGEITAVVFAGKGWGHGAGLCQVGAYGMALRGASYREILSHYYRGTKIRKLRK